MNRIRTSVGYRLATIAGVAAAATALFAAAPAHAASWTRLTTSGGSSIDEVGLLRLGSGTLHVAWDFGTDAATASLYDTTISPSGARGATNTIASGWQSIGNPALTLGPSGTIDALFGGIRTLDPSETNNDLNSSTSSDGGSSWTLQPGDVANSSAGDDAYASTISAATDPLTGTPYETWTGTTGVWVHSTLSPTSLNYDYQGSTWACCGYDSNIAFNTAGSGLLVWYSNASGHDGVWVQQVSSDGSPSGSPTEMPGTANQIENESQRTALLADRNGNFYVAYPIEHALTTKIVLWRVGATTTTTIASFSGAFGGSVGLSADSKGRLWVLWTNASTPTAYAARSNPTLTHFGAVVAAGAPRKSESMYSVDGSASPTALDLFANASLIGQSGSATWWTHIYPGLTLTASPTTVRRGVRTAVTFTVTDASTPVSGALVKIDGSSGKTNRHGRITLHLRLAKATTATVTLADYTAATIKLHTRG